MTADKNDISQDRTKTSAKLDHLRDVSCRLGACWRQTGTYALRLAAATLPFLYKKDFDALLHDCKPGIRERLIAASFQLSMDDQKKIIKGRSVRLRRALARNMQISPEIFIGLVNDSDREVRKYCLENPLCPQEYLERAARSGEDYLVCAAARNPQLPDQLVLELLERDEIRPELIDYQFMKFSARNQFFFSRCSFDTFLKLWSEPPYPYDSDPELETEFRRMIIAGRGSILVGELKVLCEQFPQVTSADSSVCLIAEDAVSCDEVQDREELFHLFGLPRADKTGPAAKTVSQKKTGQNDLPLSMTVSHRVLTRLAESRDAEVRGMLSKMPGLQSDIVSKLALDSSAEIRHNIYIYQPLPENVLEAAAKETEEYVLTSICRNIRNSIREIV
ncbi:MAG: hypothetical protein E7055_10295 [Lentisphaerae bacterium]|nr:hypothetical protein [Lentisphaerota bacterium]